ncbi:hypothetical protein KKG29_05755 [Patescibacteria group bacterium]|nr:hypothetical protein [Desulfobacteraceae bacterium]MBU4000642.1 hypothetical protein [Patescibacteria group bacterium]
MNGRVEILRSRNRLEATFKRISEIESPELQADFAKYLCILVSGYLEKSISQCTLIYANRSGTPQLERFIEKSTRRFTNANSEKILSLLGSFDPQWRSQLEVFLVDEKKDAVDSVVDLRNNIAHGKSPGITFHRIQNYFEDVIKVVDRIGEICGIV